MPAGVIIFGIVALVVVAIYGNVASGNGTVSSTVSGLLGGLDMSAPTDQSNPQDPLTIALPLLKQFESFSANAYEDPEGSGNYSIGYGHQIKPGESYNQDSTISESEASDLLRVDAASAWTCVYNNVPTTCSPQQYAALISLCFNIGCTAFKGSTLVKDLNNGDTASAADQFAVWNKATVNGVLTVSDALVERRQQEQSLFQSRVSA